jgi:hypothetical protein
MGLTDKIKDAGSLRSDMVERFHELGLVGLYPKW